MSQDIRRNVYLDYAATTPVDPEVFAAMEPFWSKKFGNPGSIHRAGQEALKALDDARQVLKEFVSATSLREIIFTGSATEANNLAIFGIIGNLRGLNPLEKVHVVTTLIEHESVLEPIRALEKKGWVTVTYISPDKEGIISPESVKKTLRPETVLVSIGYANNEIGVIQPISEIGEIIKNFRNEIFNLFASVKNSAGEQFPISKKILDIKYQIQNTKSYLPVFHTDAVQATQFLDMDVTRLGIDMMTLSAHKIYGPKGIGALYRKDGLRLSPILYGGGQEYGVRPGTENVPAIAGFAKAIQLLHTSEHEAHKKNILELRAYTIKEIRSQFKNVILNGSEDSRLPNNINMQFPRMESESVLIGLSEKYVYVSSGAACSARAQKPSHVIQALGKSENDARGSIRITLGKYTTKQDIDYFVKSLVEIVKR